MLLAPLTTNAQSDVKLFELTPYGAFSIGGTFTDVDTDVEAELQDSGSFGLLFNILHSPNTQWEILYSQQSTDADITGLTTGTESVDMTVHYLQAGGTYQGEGEVARPYLAATIGAAHYDISTEGFDSDTFFSFFHRSWSADTTERPFGDQARGTGIRDAGQFGLGPVLRECSC